MNNGRTTGAMKRVLQLLAGQGASGRAAATLYPHYAAHHHRHYPPGCEQKHAPGPASTRLPRTRQRGKLRGFGQGRRSLLCRRVFPQLPRKFSRVFRLFCGRNCLYLTFGTRPEGARWVPSARTETVRIKRGYRRMYSYSCSVAAPVARWAHCAVPPPVHPPTGASSGESAQALAESGAASHVPGRVFCLRVCLPKDVAVVLCHHNKFLLRCFPETTYNVIVHASSAIRCVR
jgi:hypothetical protein